MNETKTYKQQLISKIKQDLVAARKDVNRHPTEGQIEAGNYALGHVYIKGYDISIENPKGSVRSGIDSNGKKWSIRMRNDYGYFRSTLGYDGDAIDVFIGPDLKSDKIFVIDQIIDDKFDESKVMFGFNTEKEAMKAYKSNYERGWDKGKYITAVSDEIFREWLYDGYKQRKPFYSYVKIQKEKLNESKKNSDGQTVPETCPVCGSKVGLYIKGEPVYLCSNKECGKYFGTPPFLNHKKNKQQNINEMKINKNDLARIIRESINEVTMDTLDKARYASYDGESYFDSFFEELEAYLSDFVKRGNKQADKYLTYLSEIQEFVKRKSEQNKNFEREYNNRFFDAKRRYDKKAFDEFGKTSYQLNSDEMDAMGRNITDADERYYHNNM